MNHLHAVAVTSLLCLLQAGARQLANALKAVTPEMLKADGELVAAMQERAVDGVLLTQMVRYATQTTPLAESLRELSARQAIDVMRFVWGSERSLK